MNVKLWAGVAAVMIVLTGTGWYMSSNTPDDDSIVIISRVNTDGSGIFADPSVSIDTTKDPWVQSGWGGKIIATPGPTSIQHMMLQDLVENTFKMNFRIVPTSMNLDDNTVYWVQLGVGAMKAAFNKDPSTSTNLDPRIDGGIVWEPVFSDILQTSTREATTVVKTEEIDPGHACCVLGANRTYLESHSNDVIRFLVAYIEVVDWMNAALQNKGSQEYSDLVDYAIAFTDKPRTVVLDSFDNVSYGYELTTLKEEIIDMVRIYSSTGLVNNTVKDLGFSTEEAFANWLVNDRYLEEAMISTIDYSNADPITIKLAHLQEDIHQLALYIGSSSALGTFAEYKITIDALTPFQAGGYVAQALVRGDADIGFLGAPPVVQTTINMGR